MLEVKFACCLFSTKIGLAAEGEEEDVCITNIHILLASLRNFLDDGSWPDTNQEFYVPTLKALQILSISVKIEYWLNLQLKIGKDHDDRTCTTISHY